MQKRGNGKTSARSRRAARRSNTSGRSSSSSGGRKVARTAENAENAEKSKVDSALSARSASSFLPLRNQLAAALTWHDAHAGFEGAVAGVPPDARGKKPPGVPYSPWQLLEHLRITQHDILEFCRNPKYVEPKWPDDYWPTSDAPPDRAAWDASVDAFTRDRRALAELALNQAT